MARPESLTVGEALAQAHLIDASLAAWEETAPQLVSSLGGRDALARQCEMTCIGPVPRLDTETWLRASLEYVERRLHEQGNRYAAPAGRYVPGPAADVPVRADPSAAPRRSRWTIFGR